MKHKTETMNTICYFFNNNSNHFVKVMDRKPEMIAALSARQAQEAPHLDKGDIPGDGLGAGGRIVFLFLTIWLFVSRTFYLCLAFHQVCSEGAAAGQRRHSRGRSGSGR